MNNNNQALRKVNDERIEAAEIGRDLIIDTVGVYGPLAIPLVPAGLTLTSIGVNYTNLLHFPGWASWPMGTVSGVGVEIFGIIASENYLDMVRYNQTLQPGEEEAPVNEAREARDLYVKIVIGLLSTLEFIPALAGIIAHYANQAEATMQVISTVSVLLSLFPLAYLAVLTSRVIIMRKQHRQRIRARLERSEGEHKESIISILEGELRRRNDQIFEANNTAEVRRTFAEGLAEKLAQSELECKKLAIESEGLRRELERTNDRPIVPVPYPSEPAEPEETTQKAPAKRLPARERRLEVLRLLTQTSTKHEANFAEWSRTFGVSDTAIRGDLQWLIENDLWQNHGDWKPTPKALDILS